MNSLKFVCDNLNLTYIRKISGVHLMCMQTYAHVYTIDYDDIVDSYHISRDETLKVITAVNLIRTFS